MQQVRPFLWDRYKELEALGEGGMGKVVKAQDLGLEREVAIKRLRVEIGDPENAQRFLLEAKATGQLEHPNIPPVYELGKDEDGRPYFALKLVRGRSLQQLIAGLKAGDAQLHEEFSFILRLQIFQKVCEAVAYAHERGIIHRDIKPDNVMVGDLGEVFLMDWGLAKDQQAAGADVTQAGIFMGTPMYAAPEQISGEKATPSWDVYALGATLYEWLSLKPPYDGASVRDILTSVLTKKPTDPVFHFHPVQGRMPVEMSRLIMKAMHKDAKKRFSSVREMLDEIQNILNGEIQAVCPCTVVKSSFHGVSRILDRYPIVVFLVIPWLLYPLYALIMALWHYFKTG
ncbi:MAG: serine/threonine protein kinase [Candidatus Eremiobacteraeota bacterium]|nr:serine/threonine protein kinase [Candidatus Eremiobacteraeota bacterium]MCW5872736.1 serine/threonine protein kinase [Candidatus Eremiobacteraeota bacterium]